MQIIVFGTSFKTAPIELREQFSFSEEKILELLPKLKTLDGVLEAVILSTCNRTEIYAVCSEGFSNISGLADVLTKPSQRCLPEYFYTLKNMDAVRHLFRVAAGLESQMVGENQVLSQVKDAYKLACQAKANGPVINRLFHKAFSAGKAVRTETNLSAGAVSISSAAVELAYHLYERLSDKSVLLIGAGETGELVVKHLLDKGIGSLKIANRTRERAEELTKRYHADVVDFSDIARKFLESDMVISATGSPDYILTEEMLKKCRNGAGSKKIMVIDIAVPRDIEPRVAERDQVFLYDMDDLNVVVEKNIESRKGEVPYAEKIVNHAVSVFEKWLKGQRVVPTIRHLQERFEEVRKAEVEKNHHCSTCEKKGEVDRITKSIINKILRAPIAKLVKDTDCSEEELKYLRDIFVRDE